MLADSIAAEHSRKFKKGLTQSLRGHLPGKVFSVNGKNWAFDDADIDKPADFVISISFRKQFSELILAVSRGNRSSVSNILVETLEFESLANFRKALSSVDESRLQDLREAMVTEKRQQVVDGIVILLNAKLNLSIEQLPMMKEWVQGNLETISAQPLYLEIKAISRNKILFIESPEFLNDVQSVAWELLRNSRDPLGK